LERVRSLTGLSPVLVADLAFLLRGDLSSTRACEIKHWVEAEKAKGHTVVGLNCNAQVLGRVAPEEARQLANNFAQAAMNLAHIHPEVRFLIVPHDSRGAFSDVDSACWVLDSMGADTRQRTKLIGEAWTAAEIKGVAGLLDYAITGRMHFGIACLGAGVPVGSLTYQDKFEGLYQHFGLTDMSINGVEGLSLDRLTALFQHVHLRAPEARRTVQAKLPYIFSLARRNVAALLGQTLTD
jgi:colanic acid/amylovoran biosynthesis protein